jgi:hypothetical protein
MVAWRPNRERYAAQEAARQKEAAKDAARLLVESTVISMLKSQLTRACCIANLRPSVMFRPHVQLAETLSIVPTRSVDATEACNVHAGKARYACDVVSFPAVPWASLPKWPKTFKEKKRSEGLLAFASKVELKTVRHAFKHWQSAWHFTRYTISEMAREVDADLTSHVYHSDLRHTASWPPMASRRHVAAQSKCRSRHGVAEKVDADPSPRAYLSDLRRADTWPPMASQAKCRSQHERGLGACRRW